MTDPATMKRWRELCDRYVKTGHDSDVICDQFKNALCEIDRLNMIIERNIDPRKLP